MSEPAEPLSYATPAVDSRILFTKESDRETVVIRRPGRRVRKAAEGAGEVLIECLVFVVAAGGYVMYQGPAWLWAVVTGGVAAVVLLYAVFWFAFARFDEPIVIELTPTELVFSNMDIGPRERRFSREGLYAIRYVGHAKGVYVYRRGEEMYGFGVEEGGAEGERIAEFLREAAGLGEE